MKGEGWPPIILSGHSLANCSLAPKCQAPAQAEETPLSVRSPQALPEAQCTGYPEYLFLPLEKHKLVLPFSSSQSSLPLGPSAKLPDVRVSSASTYVP